MKSLSDQTGRNTIAYYSGWLSAAQHEPAHSVSDADKNSFMTMVHGMDRTKGLDLILHTPGGDIAAAESLVDYLHKMFGENMRAIIPQISMSAGTMIACSCKSIVMGKQSNLGPIDPQINGLPAKGVIQEFNDAIDQIKTSPESIPLWQAIIGRYHPTFLSSCQHAIVWSEQIVTKWLADVMFSDSQDSESKARKAVEQLIEPDKNHHHGRHIHLERCKNEVGLNIETLEDDQELQDLVLTVHHSFMHTLSQSGALKIVENQEGISVVTARPAPQSY